MTTKKIIAGLAVVAGLVALSFGSQNKRSEPVAATTEVPVLTATATPTPTATPQHAHTKPKPKPKPKTIIGCIKDGDLVVTPYSTPSLIMAKNEYDESVALIARQDSASEAKQVVKERDAADPEVRDEHAIGRYVVEYVSDDDSERDTIRSCVKATTSN